MTKIEMGKQYRTRDGREVRIYATDGAGNGSVHGATMNGCGGWIVMNWSKNGKACNLDEYPSDLIEIKPRIKRDVWVNVYPMDFAGDITGFTFYHTKHIADECANKKERIACVKLTIDCEEGHGL